MTDATIAVIIPHYNDAVRLGRCLDALAPQIADDIEVVVVDNGSATVPQVPDWVRLVTETTPGAANARNRGVAETRADRFFFVDSDCLPAPDWIAAARRACDRADLVGGRVTVFDETARPRSGAQAFEAVFAFDFKTYIEKRGFSGSGNLLTHRAVFDAIGGFRAGMSEDFDWCTRAVAAGFSLAYDPELVVGHPSRTDWAALERKWRRLTQESYGLLRDHPRRNAQWLLRALAMPASIVAHAPRVLSAPDLTATERARALSTLARQRLTRMRWMTLQVLGREI
ncbi:Glycosyltransferase, GT2 family [Roseivivax marinus]|uniref:glycosyltransferase family 2 protein n=1 Tax=Roseivivax marinus TaxID=1379903 RepID=UPI0008D81440|nr:glycosyltransferase family A protein [Roseivivax marinus]SEK69697.1 Glycosyltransferase, GT2 family [Roseivivax marinus]